MNYNIVHIMDHYEAYLNGKFICSGDTVNEVAREVEECLAERKNNI